MSDSDAESPTSSAPVPAQDPPDSPPTADQTVPSPPSASFYGYSWDVYVTNIFPRLNRSELEYAGDEWGGRDWWEITYQRLFTAAGSAQWEKAAEIGAGSGKFTQLLLERSQCQVLAVDVSQEFLNLLGKRQSAFIESGRLQTAFLFGRCADEFYWQIHQRDWIGQLDAVYSIDAMVHVDLQYLIAYLVTAANALRVGGKLVLTLADGSAAGGIQKLLDDLLAYFPMQGMPSLKFEFVSGDIIKAVLSRLGFRIVSLTHDAEDPARNRDLFVIAELIDPTAARQNLKYIGVGV